MGTKIMGSFLVWTSKNGSHSVCKNAISSQSLQFHVKIIVKLVKFSKCTQRAQTFAICM